MLEKLDDIPWKDLQHAYGSAEDIPYILRALAAGFRVEDAIDELHGNIWHQGTVFEASPHAVPFLFELAAASTVPARAEILGLIGMMARGTSYLAVHARPGSVFAAGLRRDPEFESKLARELAYVERTRSNILDHADLAHQMLRDAKPLVRAGAAFVLSRFPELGPRFAPLIREAFHAETDTLAAAGMLWCLAAIRDESAQARDLMTIALKDSSDLRLEFAAAAAMLELTNRFEPEAMPVYRKMAATVYLTSTYLDGIPWDYEMGLEETLLPIEPDTEGATDSMLNLMVNGVFSGRVGSSIIHDLLALNFENGNWREAIHLNFNQLRVIKDIVECDAAWADTSGLWFLTRKRGPDYAKATSRDILEIRDEMKAIVKRHTIG